jgi:adenosylcobyric acid synthase
MECREALLKKLCAMKGIEYDSAAVFDYAAYKEKQYDILADAIRENVDMHMIYKMMGIER